MLNFRCLRPELYRPREGLFLNRQFRFLHQVVLELRRLLQMVLQILQSLRHSLGLLIRGLLHLLFLKKLSQREVRSVNYEQDRATLLRNVPHLRLQFHQGILAYQRIGRLLALQLSLAS